jgi:oligosaccharide repeat unit polymerase
MEPNSSALHRWVLHPSYTIRLAISVTILVILIAMINVGLDGDTSPMYWSVGCILVAAGTSLFGSGSESFDPFCPLMIIMVYSAFLFGIRGIVVLEFDPYFFMPYVTPVLLSNALAIAVVGLVAVYIGYCLEIGKSIAKAAPIPELFATGERAYPNVVVICAIIGGLAGALILAIVRRRSLAPDVTAAAGTFWISVVMNFLPSGLLLVLADAESRRKTLAQICLIIVIVACLLIPFSQGSSKIFVIETFLVALVVRHYRVKALRAAVILLSMTASFVVMQCAKLYMGPYAGDFSALIANMFQSRWSLWLSLFSRFYGLDSLVAILIHTRGMHYEWGRTFTELLYWWVPRALWPNKPFSWSYDFSFLLANYNNPSDAGVFSAPTFFGELYLNFGLAGVVLGSVVLGIVSRALYCYFVQRIPTKTGLLLYGTALIHLGQLCESTLAVAVALSFGRICPLLCLVTASRRLEMNESMVTSIEAEEC